MGDVLAVAELRDGRLRGVSHETMAAAGIAAASYGGQVHALVVGGPGAGEAASNLRADRLKVAEHEGFADAGPDTYAKAIADVARGGGYSAVVFAATGPGKDIAPRVAALLDVPLAADVTSVEGTEGALTVVKPVYSGKAFARISFQASPAVFSVRPNAIQAESGEGSPTIEPVTVEPTSSQLEVLSFEAAGSGSVDVGEATTVVSGGRGMKGPENWNLLEALRDALGDGTGLGASRAVVDAGWRPHSEQVGQTGKTVAPTLYVAVGISGAIQHLAGMRTAGTIVAVNKDRDAPIFQVADYGIVGDLFEVVPALTEAVKAVKAAG